MINDQAHHIYHRWDECARSGEIDALLALYAPDGVFESPLVPVLMKRESGECRGHSECALFLRRTSPPAKRARALVP